MKSKRRVKVKGVRINKVLVDCRAYINVMTDSLLGKIGKYDTNFKPNNMVLLNYVGKNSKPLGVIQVDMVVGTTTRPTLSVVIPTKANHKYAIYRKK